MGTSSRNKIAVIAATSILWPAIASSQQAGLANQGGFQIDFDVNSTVKVDDNFQLKVGGSAASTYISDTKFTFGLSSITQNQKIDLSASTILRFADIPGRTVRGFEDQTLRFAYQIDAANSQLSINARYRNVDREFLNPFKVEQEEQQNSGLVGDGGTLEAWSTGLTYETGLNDPIGFKLQLNHQDRAYTNVTNPQLFDATTDTVDATVRMRMSAVTDLIFSTGVTYYDADDAVQTDRESTRYSVGLRTEIDPALVLDAQVGYSRIETDTLFTSTTRTGATGAVSLTKTLPNGTADASLAVTQNVNGGRSTLTFGRSLQLPSGTLSGRLGLTKGDTGSAAWVGSLGYTHQLKDSDVSVSVNRSATTNSLDQEILNTRVSVGYNLAVDNDSSLGLGLDWGRTEKNGAGAAATIDLTNLSASYTYALTQDWNLTGGVLYRHRYDSGAGSADSNSVYVTLNRGFSFRP